MKTLLFFTAFFCCSKLYSQDSLQVSQINTQVNEIIHSGFPTQTDSISQDYPATGLYIKIYTTIMTFGKELKKYARFTKATHQDGQITKQSIAGSTFYYDQNKLIKVEDFFSDGGNENKAEWYFSNDKCFFYTSKSDKAESRIALLLDLSNSFLKQYFLHTTP